MSQPSVLYDTLGPKGRRNVRIGTAVGVVVIIGLLSWVLWRLAGQYEDGLKAAVTQDD